MFAYERQKGTLRRLLATPTSRATYLLGTLVKTEGQANGLSIMLGMSMVMPEGAGIPLNCFPSLYRLRSISCRLPGRCRACSGLCKGQGVPGVLPAVGVLMGFAAVFFIFGVLRFKYE